MYIDGLGYDCIGFDIKNKDLPKILNLFLEPLLKAFAGGYRSDADIQIMDVYDEF